MTVKCVLERPVAGICVTLNDFYGHCSSVNLTSEGGDNKVLCGIAA